MSKMGIFRKIYMVLFTKVDTTGQQSFWPALQKYNVPISFLAFFASSKNHLGQVLIRRSKNETINSLVPRIEGASRFQVRWCTFFVARKVALFVFT